MNHLFAAIAKDPNTANAVATVASAIAAALAVLVSAIAVFVAYVTLKNQQRHNVLSVRPIPIVTVADFEDSVRIKVRNHGSGPMLITRVQVEDGVSIKESLVKWMPQLPPGMLWNNFVGPVCDRSLLPDREIVLLQLDGDCEDQAFKQARDSIRDALAPLTVVVDFTDIYGSTFEHYSKELAWFSRHQVGAYPE